MGKKKTDPEPYGMELILDLHDCDTDQFTEMNIRRWFILLAREINMKRRDVHFWVEHGHEEPHLNGVTAVQFVSTSSITIHASEHTNGARINIFSCKSFEADMAEQLTEEYFSGDVFASHVLMRY